MNPGDVISRYKITGPLGRGGMGIVYGAEDTRLQRPVALKFLPSGSITEQDKHRFMNEARAAAQARHPNICPIFDIEEADGQVFIAMAYLEGETVLRMAGRGPVEVSQAVSIAAQVADGLESAHRLGVIHRDIKSANIMVSPGGHAFIMDFGLALVSGETRLTGMGNTVGTPSYMSPEQALGRAVDGRTDVWSLGVVLFEMLTGTLPFRREHSAAIIHAILNDTAPSPQSLRPVIPAALGAAVEKALAKDPRDRWRSAGEFAAQLKRLQPGSGVFTGGDSTQVMPIARPARHRYLIAAGALVLVAVAIGFGVYRFTQKTPEAPMVPEAPAVKAPARAEQQRVAVLPFQIDGNAESTRAVADGLVEVLTTALSDFERFQGMVTAVPASEVRRRAISTPEEARRVQGANLAITGRAQAAAGNPQFTLNLIDTSSLRQVGSRSFVYDPRQPIASRNQAVAEVVDLLKLPMTSAARTAITAGDTAAPSAYSAYLAGRGLLARYDVAGNIDKAISNFQSAAKQDPNYALAFAGLGEAYWRKTRAHGDKQWAALAIANAERAVQLDGSLAIVHSILGEVYGTTGREQDAIRELQKAIQLAPGNAEAPRELARVYANLGRFQEAEASYLQATQSRPTDWYGHLLLGVFYYQRERYAEAEAELDRAKALTPDNDLIYRDLGAIYVTQGRYKDAVNELQRSLKIRSNAPTYAALGEAYFYQHRFAEAVAAAETAIDLDSSGYRYWGNLGTYYKWAAGNEGKAAPALRKAVDMAKKFLESTPLNYDVRANLAEYRARLGDSKGALAEIDSIPSSMRGSLASRLAVAYELTGHREQAVKLLRENLKSSASRIHIEDDPDLAPLAAALRP